MTNPRTGTILNTLSGAVIVAFAAIALTGCGDGTQMGDEAARSTPKEQTEQQDHHAAGEGHAGDGHGDHTESGQGDHAKHQQH